MAIAGLVAVAWFWPRPATQRGRRERPAVYAVIAALIALDVAQIIRHLRFRDRPFVDNAAHVLLAPSPDPSFPSDHAIGGFAIATPFVLGRHRLGPRLLTISTPSR